MSSDTFAQGIESARRRLAALRQRVGGSAMQQLLTLEALEEVSTLLEELHVAAEELCRQNEELVAARQNLETERQRHQDLFECAPDGYLVTDPEGIIQEANRVGAALLGLRQDLLVGKPLLVFIAEAGRAAFHLRLTRMRERAEPEEDGEVLLQPRDGAPFPAALSVGLMCDAAGRLAGLRWLVRDVSKRKRAEAQMRQAQKREALGILASGIAHEFSTSLSAIIGHCQAASDGLLRPSVATQHLQEVLAAGKRAKELVQQVHAFSRCGQEQREPVPLDSIVREAMKLLRAWLPTTIEIRQHIDPGPSLVFANATQMHQMLMNLCANAEHAMRSQGGVLEIRVEPFEVGAEYAAHHAPLSPGPHVRLTVRDTGQGMEPHITERIFDPFFTTKKAGEGTGMGLAVVHGIVASHGGAITVESAPGQGTQCEVLLPRCDGLPIILPVDAGASCVGRERLLIVDDAPSLAHLWGELLERFGYRFVACLSGAEALTAFQSAPESFDLVITDLVMPQMTGDALARELLRIRPDLPIILCTGFSNVMTEEKAKAMGIRAYLKKPLGARDLALAIRSVLGQPTAPTP